MTVIIIMKIYQKLKKIEAVPKPLQLSHITTIFNVR